MASYVLSLNDKLKIPGESALDKYIDWVDVEGIEHGIAMPMVGDKSSNSRTSNRCSHQDVTCTMRLNKAYPKLLESCAKGINLGKADLVLLKMSESKISEIARYSLTDVYIAEILLIPSPIELENGGRDTALPWVQFKLNYQSIAVTYNQYGAAGANLGAVSCDALTGLGA